jgi:glutamate--cysteine ligase
MNYKIKSKNEFEDFLIKNWKETNLYLNFLRKKSNPPLYSSVDIREGQFKLAPIDHNIYPAGFNNLCSIDLKFSGRKIHEYISEANFGFKRQSPFKLAIIPESHTKNKFYFDHLSLIKESLLKNDVDILFITFDEVFLEGKGFIDVTNSEGSDLRIYRSVVENKKVYYIDESNQKNLIDFIILNNDQSFPLDVDWNAIDTIVTPSPYVGWNHRSKIEHFKIYKNVAEEFCKEFSIDPNLIIAKFRYVNDIDFINEVGLEKLAFEVSELFKELNKDAKIFIKASQGTYGMGIMTVSSVDEILKINRKVKNKMDRGKNNIKFTSFLIQEGVETIIYNQNAPAEAVIYLVAGESVGGFLRANPLRPTNGNLNSKGMVFHKFCISEIRSKETIDKYSIQEAMNSVVAELSTCASGIEIMEIEKRIKGIKK